LNQRRTCALFTSFPKMFLLFRPPS
jgi:hypothetical protein